MFETGSRLPADGDCGPNSDGTFSAMTSNVSFFSSELFPTNLGGVEPYDAACNRLAISVGINNAGGKAFVGWLATARHAPANIT
jgi:hypothetical protein